MLCLWQSVGGVGTLYLNSRNTGCCVCGSQEVVLVHCILTAETLWQSVGGVGTLYLNSRNTVAVSRWCWYIVS